MLRHGAANWGLPVTALLAASGAGAVWLATLVGGFGSRAAALSLGAMLLAASVAMVVFTAIARVKQDAVDRKMAKYACTKCGYTPHLDEMTHEQSYPCPMCGKPVYE